MPGPTASAALRSDPTFLRPRRAQPTSSQGKAVVQRSRRRCRQRASAVPPLYRYFPSGKELLNALALRALCRRRCPACRPASNVPRWGNRANFACRPPQSATSLPSSSRSTSSCDQAEAERLLFGTSGAARGDIRAESAASSGKTSPSTYCSSSSAARSLWVPSRLIQRGQLGLEGSQARRPRVGWRPGAIIWAPAVLAATPIHRRNQK